MQIRYIFLYRNEGNCQKSSVQRLRKVSYEEFSVHYDCIRTRWKCRKLNGNLRGTVEKEFNARNVTSVEGTKILKEETYTEEAVTRLKREGQEDKIITVTGLSFWVL